MNFLAHAYLSFEDPEVLTGNMISDFVKGKRRYEYPERIQAGIALHRAIDAFTDEHPATRAAAALFQPVYGRYHLAFMDVVYDHFLAAELSKRGNNFFQGFVTATYERLAANAAYFPDGFAMLFPHMKRENWLFNYQWLSGIQQSFGGLVRRARYISDSKPAYEIFERNYAFFQAAYDEFFPALLGVALEKFADIH